MKKLITLSIVLAAFAAISHAQTATEIVTKVLEVRNSAICDGYGLDATCTDAQVQAAWCEKNNKPAGAMCAASDTRTSAEKVLSAAQFYVEQQAEADKRAAEKAVKARKALLVSLEIAILDPAVRSAVCAAAKVPAEDCQ